MKNRTEYPKTVQHMHNENTRRKENRTEAIFEAIMPENFPH